MSTAAEVQLKPTRPSDESAIDLDWFLELVAAIPQAALGLLPRTCQRILLWLVATRADQCRGAPVLGRSLAAAAIGVFAFGVLFTLCVGLLAVWAHLFPLLIRALAAAHIIGQDSGWLNLVPAGPFVQLVYALMLAYLTGLFVRAPYEAIGRPFRVLRGILWLRQIVARLTGFLFLLGLGLLPLTALLMFLPIVMPQEAVLTDTIAPARNGWHRFRRRAFAALAGISVFLALLTFATQIVTWTGFRSAVYGDMAKQIIGSAIADRLPKALVEGWPFVLLIVYGTDFLLLFAIGKVPLQYNFRNLRVRWVTTTMTGIAFTVVVFLLVLMSSFVDSVNRLTANSGIPGNVFVLSEGATDELFSNLGYGDVDTLELEQARTDLQGRPLAKPVAVKTSKGKAGRQIKWCSKETYFVINQEIPNPTGEQVRRFVQLRGVQDAEVAALVHKIDLEPGGEWFGTEGAVRLADGSTAVPCVLGQGAAAAFGADSGRERLEVGDRLKLGDTPMVVVGIMKSAGRTFDSETWATNARVSKAFGKQAYTTVVIRINDDDPETAPKSAELMAYHLTKNFTTPRVRAVPEPRYYEDLAKSNSSLMYMVVMVALIMSLGGIIGVMLVMFAAISQRIKDIGVMRVVGYKRWQILVSFMLESLAIAIIGGLVGVLLILLVNGIATAYQGGLTITSSVSGGQGSGKTVVTNLVFGTDVLAGGILFTIVMGRLGGLLPSVGAMRLGILESLR